MYKSKLLLTYVAIALVSPCQASAAPICSDDMKPEMCAEIQLDAAGKILAEYKQEISRLDAEIAAIKLKLSESKKSATYGSPERSFNTIYQNNSDRPMLVIITAAKNLPGNTMLGSVSDRKPDLPTGTAPNNYTVVSTAFAGNGEGKAYFAISMSFMVPPKSFYNVITDGGNAALVYWTETNI